MIFILGSCTLQESQSLSKILGNLLKSHLVSTTFTCERVFSLFEVFWLARMRDFAKKQSRQKGRQTNQKLIPTQAITYNATTILKT